MLHICDRIINLINMENEKELNARILSLTELIQEKYPEILKYLDEMPLTIPDQKKPKINVQTLSNYYDSLHNLLKKHLVETANKE